MRTVEHSTQVACITWFRYQHAKYLIYAIPNGGERSKVVAAKLKAEGVVSGVPDLFIAVAKGGFHGLYVEMKAGKNKPTGNQLTIMDKLKNEGYKCAVCYSIEEFMCVVNEYLLFNT